eukprot:11195007-Lingulodinium_polyedra.AAC.1
MTQRNNKNTAAAWLPSFAPRHGRRRRSPNRRTAQRASRFPRARPKANPRPWGRLRQTAPNCPLCTAGTR